MEQEQSVNSIDCRGGPNLDGSGKVLVVQAFFQMIYQHASHRHLHRHFMPGSSLLIVVILLVFNSLNNNI